MIEYQTLVDNGVMAVIIGWFMFRMEKAFKKNTEVLSIVVDRLNNGRKRK